GYAFFRNAAEEYQLGVRAFMRAKFLEAEGHFDRCIRAAPNEYKAYFARGHARLKRHDFAGAFTDFEKADACRRPGWDGRSRFCMAYCLTRLDRHLEAIPFYTQAIQAGFDPAPAYNNRAFSLWKRRKMNYND